MDIRTEEEPTEHNIAMMVLALVLTLLVALFTWGGLYIYHWHHPLTPDVAQAKTVCMECHQR